MIGKQNVAVAASGTNGEATCIVSVKLVIGFDPDMEFLGFDDGEFAGDFWKVLR